PPYIVMRFMPIGTLKDILEQARLPLAEIIHIYRQLTSALDYAHRQGVVHRDIKPSNIMIDGDGNAFLTDFGIARMTEGGQNLTGTGMAVGTPGYMAPEQSLGVQVDGRADLYSLGVMLFEMATGQQPYEAETPMAVLLKHINDPVPSARVVDPSVSLELDRVIYKAMAKAPDERYATGAALLRDLQALQTALTDQPDTLVEIAQKTITEMRVSQEFITPAAAAAFGLPDERPTITGDSGTQLPRTDPHATATSAFAGEGPTQHGGTPTDLRAAPGAGPRRGRSGVIIGIVVVLLLLGAGMILLALQGGGDDDDDSANRAQQTASAQTEVAVARQTDVQIAAQQTATEVANVALSTEAATDPVTPTEAALDPTTETPPRSETEQPTEAAVVFSPTPTPTATTTPTDTPTPSPTPTASPTNTLTFTPTNTPTDATARIIVTNGVIYEAPDLRSAVIAPNVPLNTRLTVIGETPGQRWYLVNGLGLEGWILADQVEVTGNFDTIAVVISPTPTPSFTPLPTATPFPTVAYRNDRWEQVEMPAALRNGLDRSWLAFANVVDQAEGAVQRLYLLRPGSWQRATVFDIPASAGDRIFWSPTGLHVAYFVEPGFDPAGNEVGGLYILDLELGLNYRLFDLRTLTPRGIAGSVPTWSPDGSRLALTLPTDYATDVFVVDKAGSTVLNVTQHPSYDMWPSFSPNGLWLAFVSDRNTCPTWTPNEPGTCDAPSAQTPAQGNLFLLNMNTLELRQVTDIKLSSPPTWTTDTRLTFASSGGIAFATESSVWMVDTEAGTATQIGEAGALNISEAWSDDALRVVYQQATTTTRIVLSDAFGRVIATNSDFIFPRYGMVADWASTGQYVAIGGRGGQCPYGIIVADPLLELLRQPATNALACDPTYAPEGDWLAFTAIRPTGSTDGRSDIYVSNPNGIGAQVMTSQLRGQIRLLGWVGPSPEPEASP
ncbi:MAG: protein kinase, partial [Anaerolineae bacterium]|nr:protein kinase [Anaerolineae bacterium]